MAWRGPTTGAPATAPDDGYKWVALSNTTAGVFMSPLDGSIVIIAPAGDLPWHRPRPAGARQHRLPAVDDHGYRLVFSVAAVLSVLGAAASLLRGGRYVPRD